MERRVDKYEKEYGGKKEKEILYYWSLIINCNITVNKLVLMKNK